MAASWVYLFACGARSEIAGSDIVEADDGSVDATLDVIAHGDAAPKPDASVDAPVDASVDAFDAGLCCDLGVKQSGCHPCNSGDTCWSKVGSCAHGEPECGPSNGKGCCLTASQCADGTEVGACGNAGQMCQTCFDSKNNFLACVPSNVGGTCAGGPTCNPKNCDMGCCNGNVCMVGDVDGLCGFGGIVCADCTKLAGFCDAGVCQNPHQ